MRLSLFATIALTACALCAADRPEFSGTWKLDSGASSGEASSWASLSVARKGQWFRMAQNDKDGRVIREFEGECKADGRFHPIAGGEGGSIACKWEGQTLITRQHWDNDRNERSIRTMLGPDGKLVQDIHETTASGNHDSHLVWTRE